jgi:hypothetical protein
MSSSTPCAVEHRVLHRRNGDRFNCRLLEEIPEEAELRDISPLGLGLVCESPMSAGKWLSLHLSQPGHPLGLGLGARVIHSQRGPDGRWLAGCAFDNNLPEALLGLFA